VELGELEAVLGFGAYVCFGALLELEAQCWSLPVVEQWEQIEWIFWKPA
jgi:hypothetical protein